MSSTPPPMSQVEIDALLELVTLLASEHDLERLFEQITEGSRRLLRAEHSCLFLLDPQAGEVWSTVRRGDEVNEVRIQLGQGIAGHVALTGETVNIADARQDPRFNQDEHAELLTSSVLCVPMKNRRGEIIGILQLFNRADRAFTVSDELLLGALAVQAAVAWETAVLVQDAQQQKRTSDILVNVMQSLSSALELGQLLKIIVTKTSEAMNCERCTLFVVDPETDELWSRVAQGDDIKEIRLPKGSGIVGHVAVTGETVNIPDAYADARFNPEVDRKSGFRTRNMLTMPVTNEHRDIVGVLQVLNKKRGAFNEPDQRLLGALAAQIAVALQNAQLFEKFQFLTNYNDGILRSIRTSVVTIDPDGAIAYINSAGLNLAFDLQSFTKGQGFEEFFGSDANLQLVNGIRGVLSGNEPFTAYDLVLRKAENEKMSVNVHAFPLLDKEHHSLGLVVVADDITHEQRLMSTLCRYVTRSVAEQVLKNHDEIKLGGKRSEVVVLFADIRNFTSVSEQCSAEEVVSMLNQYFSRAIEPIFRYEGTLDKYIGDAIMAVFGTPVAHTDDSERAVMAALEMRRALHKFNLFRQQQGAVPIDIGIGITRGEAVSGNIGGEQRMDYTVIGSPVNLASRLEGLSKNFEQKIIVNRAVYEDIKDLVSVVNLGFVKVKGMEADVEIFGIPDLPDHRRHPRAPLEIEMLYAKDGGTMEAVTADLSASGVSFRAAGDFKLGTLIPIRLRLPSTLQWLDLDSRVRTLRDGIVGVEFDKIADAKAKILADLSLFKSN